MRGVGVMLLTGVLQAQSAPDATALLQRAKSFGENTRSWRAEAVQTMQVSEPGLKIPSTDIHIKLAADSPLRMSKINSGDDRTTMVCDGTQQFYSGDGLSYYLNQEKGQCSFPLLSFYEPSLMNFMPSSSSRASALVIGEDHVRLTDGEKRCIVVRIVLNRESTHAVRTMCIDPTRPVILRDVVNIENKEGFSSLITTTFVSFEDHPTFGPDAFRIIIPSGAYRAH